MSTSGWFRSSADLLVEHDCGFAGMVPAVEDLVHGVWVLTWVCPGCGHEEEEELA